MAMLARARARTQRPGYSPHAVISPPWGWHEATGQARQASSPAAPGPMCRWAPAARGGHMVQACASNRGLARSAACCAHTLPCPCPLLRMAACQRTCSSSTLPTACIRTLSAQLCRRDILRCTVSGLQLSRLGHARTSAPVSSADLHTNHGNSVAAQACPRQHMPARPGKAGLLTHHRTPVQTQGVIRPHRALPGIAFCTALSSVPMWQRSCTQAARCMAGPSPLAAGRQRPEARRTSRRTDGEQLRMAAHHAPHLLHRISAIGQAARCQLRQRGNLLQCARPRMRMGGSWADDPRA